MINTSANIINGTQEARNLLDDLSKNIAGIKNIHNIRPALAIIIIGSDPASVVYVQNKINAAYKVGIEAVKISLPEDVSNAELFKIVDKLNNDIKISGIIIQLPIPMHLNKDKLLSSIIPEKDVDGFHPFNVGCLHSNSKGWFFVPGTALGCLYLGEKYEPNLAGKHVVVVGRSNIVGKPLSGLFLNKDCTVTVCHSKTQKLKEITYTGDIVLTAIGKPKYFTSEYFNKQSIVIDIGMNRINNKLTGDVDFNNVCNKVRYITPVPGGVGPMTVAFLLINTFKAMMHQYGLEINRLPA